MATRNIPYLKLSGTYRDVGESIGKTMKTGIQKYLAEHTYLHERMKPFVNTSRGRTVYNKYLDHVKAVYPQCIWELESIALGAEVEFEELFLMNIEPEISGILGDTEAFAQSSTDKDAGVPGSKDESKTDGSNFTKDEKYVFPTTSGCTDIFFNNKGNNVTVHAHTEDYSPEYKDACAWLDVTISDVIFGIKVYERFSFFIIAGLLPGGMFGVVSPSFLLSANAIYQRFVNLEGTPRRVLNRVCLRSSTLDDYVSKATVAKGIASGYNINILQKSEDGTTFCCTSLELAASDDGGVVHLQTCNELYYHVNVYRHLDVPHVLESSSIQRSKTIDHLLKQKPPKTKHEILEILSNEDKKKYPVYRNAKSPDYLETIFTGVFDLTNMKIEVYTNKPSCTAPVLVLDMMDMFR